MKKNNRKQRKTIQIIGVGIFLFLFLGTLFLFKNSALPARAADNILRPVLGEKKTVKLESWYFSLSDTVQRLTYQFNKPESNLFSSNLVNGAFVNNPSSHESMNLAPLHPISGIPALPLEGIWQNIPVTHFPSQMVLAKTFFRPDSSRHYAIVSFVKMNMSKLSLGLQGGTYYPGGIYHVFGSGIVPKEIQATNSLIAAFNGGFMAKDGHYGMIVGNKTYVPLRRGLATLIISTSGSAKIIDYEGQIPNPKTITAIRQNGTFLVKNGVITPFVEGGADTWGRTTTNSMYTWRSGIGITKNGNLIYAVGNSLVPKTLATALKEAGAVNAMQLDINPFWVRYVLYESLGNGKYTYAPLLKDMENGGYSYLHGYNKDFFYVYKKS